ncbi:MAG: hypothetical protein A2W17_03920 [Planctomycetes bacterium RBG_16_41_13]|nr:MAG: hypothetical protein A2W17_03920 [Planctomycetes bacterium RBG_16_41_13]
MIFTIYEPLEYIFPRRQAFPLNYFPHSGQQEETPAAIQNSIIIHTGRYYYINPLVQVAGLNPPRSVANLSIRITDRNSRPFYGQN